MYIIVIPIFLTSLSSSVWIFSYKIEFTVFNYKLRSFFFRKSIYICTFSYKRSKSIKCFSTNSYASIRSFFIISRSKMKWRSYIFYIISNSSTSCKRWKTMICTNTCYFSYSSRRTFISFTWNYMPSLIYISNSIVIISTSTSRYISCFI